MLLHQAIFLVTAPYKCNTGSGYEVRLNKPDAEGWPYGAAMLTQARQKYYVT